MLGLFMTFLLMNQCLIKYSTLQFKSTEEIIVCMILTSTYGYTHQYDSMIKNVQNYC